MRPQLVHRVGVELDVRIDPHRLVEAVDQGVGGHLVAALIDGCVAAHAPHRIAAPLQLLQGALTAGVDEARERDENHALTGVEWVFGG